MWTLHVSAVGVALSAVWCLTIGGCGGGGGGGAPPTVNASFVVTGSAIVSIGTTVSFDASGSTGLVGTETFDWDFGDGTMATGLTGTTAANPYNTSGVFDVTVTVNSSSGSPLDSVTLTAAVLVYDPTLTPGGAVTGLPTGAVGPAPQSLTLDSSGLTPPGAQTITGIIYDWGDGSSDVAATPATPTSHTYPATGNYPILVLVQYDDGTIGAVTGNSLVVTNSVWGTMIWGTDNWTQK